MNITIEKGIEIPSVNANNILENITPIKDMELGDSFLYTNPDEANLVSRIGVYGQRNSKKFLSRKVEGGRRVWRIK